LNARLKIIVNVLARSEA